MASLGLNLILMEILTPVYYDKMLSNLANPHAFQVTCTNLQAMAPDLKKLFWKGIEVMWMAKPHTQAITVDVITRFELRWRKKMIHARINAFIRGYYQKKAEETGRFSKGGLTLRDDLYALAKASRKQKAKRQ